MYIFSIYLCIFVCANIFGAIVLKPRFKIDVVVVVIWSIVIIINSVLNLQVSTASLPHDCEPCEIKVVSNHTCSLHTCVCAGSHRVRVRLSGLINGRNQFNSWGSPQVPLPVWVCAEQLLFSTFRHSLAFGPSYKWTFYIVTSRCLQNWFIVFFSFERDKTQVQYFYGSYCIMILDMLRVTLPSGSLGKPKENCSQDKG